MRYRIYKPLYLGYLGALAAGDPRRLTVKPALWYGSGSNHPASGRGSLAVPGADSDPKDGKEKTGYGPLFVASGGHHLAEALCAVSYTHLRAHETRHDLVCRLLLEKKKNK